MIVTENIEIYITYILNKTVHLLIHVYYWYMVKTFWHFEFW